MKKLLLIGAISLLPMILGQSEKSTPINFKTQISKNNQKELIHMFIESELDSFGSNLTADSILFYSKQYNLDPLFMMAQARLESHYGTRGLGKSHNNPWNHGITGNGWYPNYRYDYPDQAIKGYCELLVSSYLVNDVTIYDFMDSCINIRGERYAEDTLYEIKIKRVYSDLLNNFKIYKDERLQKENKEG